MAENSWRILLIDDEQDIRDVLEAVLKDAGYSVQTAADGLSGIALISVFRPQIVITDIRMPQMDGMQVLEKIKNKHPDTEVIVATAFADMQLAIQALQLDASDFITKPINNDALLVAIHRARQRHEARLRLKEYTRYLESGWDETTRELMETVRYQHDLIESSMDGIVGCDPKQVVVTFNKSMTSLLGFTKSEVLGQFTLAQLFAPGEHNRFEKQLRSSALGGRNRLFLFEAQFADSKGGHVPVQVSATEMPGDNQAAGLVCFVRDLRQMRRMEQQMADQARILHQDKMMSLGRLAASVAHEINNPLSGILNYIRLMRRVLERGSPDETHLEKFNRYLRVVDRETERCSQIVSNLLAFSRKSPTTRTHVALQQVIERCIVLSRHRMELNRVEMVNQVPDHLPAVMGDVNQLQQCLINLIFNAIDAMPDGGTLTLAAVPIDRDGMVGITVSDTGHGIAKTDLPHIFEPFFSTKATAGGVGLGLSTTFGIIERHGGQLKVDRTSPDGTTFSIGLPPVEGAVA